MMRWAMAGPMPRTVRNSSDVAVLTLTAAHTGSGSNSHIKTARKRIRLFMLRHLD
jgi:hypothetical protein